MQVHGDKSRLFLTIAWYHSKFRKIKDEKIKFKKEVCLKLKRFKKDSLDSIPSPSPSVTIQFIGGKVYLR